MALVEHKNNGAISVSCWRNLNEQPITQVCQFAARHTGAK